MREINLIAVHCSATPRGRDIGRSEITAMHLARGFNTIGYHFVIRLDGTREIGRPLGQAGAHVAGHNANSIGICLVGGLDAKGKPEDTFTLAQYAELVKLVRELRTKFPHARICGHRDLSPDKDRDGKVEKHEWLKDCPCFDVRAWCDVHAIDHTPVSAA